MKYIFFFMDKNSLEQKRVPIWLIILFTITIFSAGFISGSLTRHPNEVEKLFLPEEVIVERYNQKFSEDNLKSLLQKLHVKNIDIVIAQSKIETGNFKSKVFLENNNLFGMRQARQRITTSTGTNLNHATYDNWQDSVIDYAIYQSTYLKSFNRNEYLDYLQANYAENPNYVKLIKQMTK